MGIYTQAYKGTTSSRRGSRCFTRLELQEQGLLDDNLGGFARRSDYLKGKLVEFVDVARYEVLLDELLDLGHGMQMVGPFVTSHHSSAEEIHNQHWVKRETHLKGAQPDSLRDLPISIEVDHFAHRLLVAVLDKGQILQEDAQLGHAGHWRRAMRLAQTLEILCCAE